MDAVTCWQAGLRIRITSMRIRLQPFTFMRIRIQLFILIRIRIRILLLIIVIEIYGHWSIDLPGLHFKPPGLHSERPRLYFQPLKLLNFAFNANPDPVFPSIADSDPASKK
jgi:hypothetical protein